MKRPSTFFTRDRSVCLLMVGAILVSLCLSHTGGFVPLARSGGVIHVAPNGSDTSGDGSATAPYRTIQHAVDVANSGDTIKVAQGTYTSTGEAVVSIVYESGATGKNLTIVGGYAPPDWNIPSTDPTKTIIDGQGSRRGIYIVSVPEIQIAIQGMTVQNGRVDYRHPLPYSGEFSGGGLYCQNNYQPHFVTLTLSNLIFRNNLVLGSGKFSVTGGGVSLYQKCRATLQNVTFEGNEVRGGDAVDGTRGAYAMGGGLFATAGGNIVMENVTFVKNKAKAGSGGRGYGSQEYERADALGGAATFFSAVVNVEGITANANESTAGQGSQYGGFGCGGALFFEFSTVTVREGVLQGNKTTGGGSLSTNQGGAGSGGAFFGIDSSLTLERLVMIENSSFGGAGVTAGHGCGGAMYFSKSGLSNISRVTGTNLIMAANEARAGEGQDRWGGGGAVLSQNTELTLKHATIVGNKVLSSMIAPAVIVNHNPFGTTSVANIYHSIIANHPSGAYGAAVIAGGAGDVINLDRTLFWENTGGNYAAINGGAVNSTNEIDGDPVFHSPGAPDFDYHIQGHSSARDTAISSTVKEDIDGDSRPIGATSDIGADEYHTAYLSTSSRGADPSHLAAASGPAQVTHQITLRNTEAEDIALCTLTDTLSIPPNVPINVEFLSEPSCTSGECRFERSAQSVLWEGTIPARAEVEIMYAVLVTMTAGFTETVPITTEARFHYVTEEGSTGSGTLTAWVIVNGKNIYLPLTVKAR